MRTKYRFIEGYQGNDTVRGWREYDSIYHAVFADMRGSPGYPKGEAYSTVPQGLLLRPAIPNDENFGLTGTAPTGPRRISRSRFASCRTTAVPDYRHRREVQRWPAARSGRRAAEQSGQRRLSEDPKRPGSVTIPKAGIYQVDVYPPEQTLPAPDVRGSAKDWPDRGRWMASAAGQPAGRREVGRFSVRQGGVLSGGADSVRDPPQRCDERRRRRFHGGGLDPSRANSATRGSSRLAATGSTGWYLDLADNRGALRFETSGAGQPVERDVVLRAGRDSRQHLAACRVS